MSTFSAKDVKITYSHDEVIILKGSQELRQVYYHLNTYLEPPPEAEAAFKRIRTIIDNLDANDVALIKQWHGNPMLYTMVGHRFELTDEHAERLREQAEQDALERFPGHRVVTQWHWNQGCQDGFTIRLLKEEHV